MKDHRGSAVLLIHRTLWEENLVFEWIYWKKKDRIMIMNVSVYFLTNSAYKFDLKIASSFFSDLLTSPAESAMQCG